MDNKKTGNPLYLIIILILLVLIGLLTFLLLKPKTSGTDTVSTPTAETGTEDSATKPASTPLSSTTGQPEDPAISTSGTVATTSSSTISDTFTGVRSAVGLTSELNDSATITLDSIVVGDKSWKAIMLTDVITDGTWMYQKFIVADLTFTAKTDTEISQMDVSVYSSVNQGSSSYAMGDAAYPNADLQRNNIYEQGPRPLKAGESVTLSYLIPVPTDVIASTYPAYLQITPYLFGDRYFEQTIQFDITQYVK